MDSVRTDPARPLHLEISGGLKMYADKSFSQNVALALFIGSSVLLIPAGFGLMLAGLIFFAALLEGKAAAVLFGSALFAVASLGFAMFLGYLKHWQNRLDDRFRIPLWAGSFVFNVAPLLPLAHYIQATPGARLFEGGGFVFLPILLWWAAASVLSAAAFFESYKERVR